MFDAEKFLQLVTVICALALISSTGCFWRTTKTDTAITARASSGQTNFLITPSSPIGHVARINPQSKIVVVNFPVGQVPPDGTRLSIFRAGQKVGEVKLSEWAADTFRVGDFTGLAEVGDEVRAQ